MKLATFNVENMFERPKVMNLSNWKMGKQTLEDYKQLNELIQKTVYTPSVKSSILNIMNRHKGLLTQKKSAFIQLNDLHGKFLKKPKGKPYQIIANGRSGWLGWFELINEAVSEPATENTARIIDLVHADVQCVVEVENRIVLKRFNADIFKKIKAKPFDHVMVIDGNDERGIDVGIMTREGYEIICMLSHVDDWDKKGEIFSRDCAEYEINTPKGNHLLLLVNHFKSKGYGKPAQSNAKRLRQTTRVREIYDSYIKAGYEYIAVLGDFNEIPANSSLDPLLRNGSTLTDIMSHPKFQGSGRPGTYRNMTKNEKLDYILMSPKLSAKVITGDIECQGVWGGKNGTLFPHLKTINSETEAASDHAALWVELDI
ncbi:MAG: endonuclease/exonuclease/phosphatase family protein [Bacteroidetes bacterium]|nr:MAG: endonuclease/exonuclease/phosphatase family protein [Bacteroidota bacterium]